jgi:hypothetical protein
MVRTPCLLFILVSLASCSTGDAPKQLAAPVASGNLSAVPAASSPEKTVREYLRWYSANYNKLPTNFILRPDGKDTTGYYAVDLQVTENWLVAVRNSGVLSDAYLQNWRTYFKQYADTLRLHPQNDGPPRGFEYDFLMLSQEADNKVAELQAGTFTTKLVSDTRATVAALGPQHEGWREGMTFTLSKSATGEWLIDTMRIPDNLTQ